MNIMLINALIYRHYDSACTDHMRMAFWKRPSERLTNQELLAIVSASWCWGNGLSCLVIPILIVVFSVKRKVREWRRSKHYCHYWSSVCYKNYIEWYSMNFFFNNINWKKRKTMTLEIKRIKELMKIKR